MLYTPGTYTAPTADLTRDAFRLAHSVLYPEPIPLSDTTGALSALEMDALAAVTNKIYRSAAGSSTSPAIRFETIREVSLAGGVARTLGYTGLVTALGNRELELKAALRAHDAKAVSQASVVDGECARQVLETAVMFPGTIIPTHVYSGQRPKILIPAIGVQAAIAHKLADVPPSGYRLGDVPVASPMDIIFTGNSVPRRTISALGRKVSGLLHIG
jgi:hypothetical protein